MSDANISQSDLQFKLNIERPSLKYTAQLFSRKTLFAVDIPYRILKLWHDLIERGHTEEGTTSDFPSTSSGSYTDLLERSIPAGVFSIRDSAKVREEIHDTLRKVCGSVNSIYKKTSGRKRSELDSKTRKFHIFECYVDSFNELKREKEYLAEDLLKWKRSFKDLEGESQRLCDEMLKELEKKDEVINDLSSANEELQSYVDCLAKSEGISYKGKSISDVKKKTRTLKCFLSRAKTALWFAESFGLDVSSINVAEKKTGIVHSIPVAECDQTITGAPTTVPTEGQGQHGFDAISQENKQKVEEILFLLDKFYVGDEFYHEVSMLVDSLPKSYLIKQRRDQLNKLCSISRLPGKSDGCQVDFQDTLKQCLQEFISKHPDYDFFNNSVRIKISGDGAQMTRNTNFIILSLAILDGSGNALSAKGNHSIAVVKGSESYEVLQESFGDVFNSINSLNTIKQIEVNNIIINLELFLGGDYKFLLLMLGLKGATSNHSCIWCKIHKDQRWDMSHDLSYYNLPPLKRTIGEISEMAGRKKDNYCCARQPLLHIDLNHVILDELHLMLRVTDVLINNVMEDVLEWDKTEDVTKKRCEERGKHLQNLISTVRSCGVSFNIWQKANADGKGSGKYECTSLLGNDKKILLKVLPSKLRMAIQEETCDTVIKIWQDFNELYQIITKVNPTAEDIHDYFENAKNWVRLFLSMAGKCKGYTRARVTPYIHAMVYHLPQFLSDYRTVKIFTGQGVEKNNDVARSTVLKKSNKWDSTSDVLQLESRQWQLRQHERNKRAYEKSNLDYWEKGILEARQHKINKKADNVGNE